MNSQAGFTRNAASQRGRHFFVGGFVVLTAVAPVAAQQLEEVIVTATKRDKLLSDVPVAVTALDGDVLRKQGINDIRQILYVSPSVTFNAAVNPGGDTLRIRGVGSPGFASGVEQSVGTIIDGVVTGSSGSGLAALWDLERIEVLRGPQGTLFGKNVSAGAISVVSKAPTDELEGFVNLRYREKYEAARMEFGVSGPLGGGWRGRVAGFLLDEQVGEVEEVVRESETNMRSGGGLRLRADYSGDGFSADIAVAYNENDNRCCTVTFNGVNQPLLDLGLPATNTANDLVNNLAPFYGISLNGENRVSIADAPERSEEEVWHNALTLSWDLPGEHTLKSITGYRSWEQNDRTDSEKLPIDLVNNTNTVRDMDLFTEELQLLSPTGQTWEYVLGLFLFHQSFDETQNTGGGLGNDIAEMSMDIDNAAVYGQATYNFNDRWAAFFGARLLWEQFDIVGERFNDPVTGGLPIAAFLFDGGDDLSRSDTDWTGTAGIQYFPTADDMYYLSVSRGYKGAGVDTAPSGALFSANIETSPILDPETVIAWELGAKNRWADGRVATNLAVFYNEFDDFHASSFDAASSGILLRNAGKITVQGIELDVNANLWSGATLNFGAAWIDAEFDEYTGAPCTTAQAILEGCTSQDLSGRRVNNAPEFSYSATLRQDFGAGRLGDAYLAVDYFWKDDFIFNGDLDPFTAQEAYGLGNLRLGLLPSQKLELIAFVQNFTDETYALRILPAPVVAGAYSALLAPERTFGVEARWTFY